jgi:hypothetical protein
MPGRSKGIHMHFDISTAVTVQCQRGYISEKKNPNYVDKKSCEGLLVIQQEPFEIPRDKTIISNYHHDPIYLLNRQILSSVNIGRLKQSRQTIQ